VRDKSLLARLAAGKKVDFEFVKDDDDYVLTAVK
jgi:Cu/Ag efflux protein CusF